MKEKYLVYVYSNKKPTDQSLFFKTRCEMALFLQIPLYVVDKIIKISNDITFKTKRKCHPIYQKLVDTIKIIVLKAFIHPHPYQDQDALRYLNCAQ